MQQTPTLSLFQHIANDFLNQPRQTGIFEQIEAKNERFSKLEITKFQGIAGAAVGSAQFVAIRLEQIGSVVLCAGYLIKHTSSALLKGVDALTTGNLQGVKNAFNGGVYKAAIDFFTAFAALGSVVAPETVNTKIRSLLPAVSPSMDTSSSSSSKEEKSDVEGI